MFLTLALGTVLVGCGGKQEATTAQTETAKVLVKTETAITQTVAQTEEFTANIEPYKKNYITPAVQGVRIDRILVDVGDRVKKGQLLVEMDPTNYNQQRVNLQNAQDTYDRTKKVFEVGGVSQQQLDQAHNNLTLQKEVIANLEKNIKLLSPINGVVTARNDEAGNLFANQPILQVMQIDRLKVTVNISEQFYPVVKLGTPVKVGVDIFPGEEFDGKVTLIYPAMDAATRTFTVEITIPNASERLRPGMFSRSTFNMGNRESVMISDVAVARQAGTAERYAFVEKDGVAERRVVRLGRQVGNLVEVLSGIEAGEKVIVTGLSKLEQGTPVEVQN
ncbi:MAG: efflux RND transporter periplasmic adaptor subunit [Rikenellaceae bacterium]|nr:efflux RND transporter periplasmic adaptor subunit [Rikenellaceae bacterium]